MIAGSKAMMVEKGEEKKYSCLGTCHQCCSACKDIQGDASRQVFQLLYY
jgi:hypothetical protein